MQARHIASAGCGILVTLALFAFMISLVRPQAVSVARTVDLPSFTFMPQEVKPDIKDPPPKHKLPPPPTAVPDGGPGTSEIRIPHIERPTHVSPSVDLIRPEPDTGIREFPTADPGFAESAPRRVAGMNPIYPHASRMRGIEGEVTVRIAIDASGNVTDVKVLSATPPRVFEAAVHSAVARWRFAPPVVDGIAQPAAFTETFEFRLEDEG